MSKKRAAPNWKRNSLNTAVALAISGMCAAPAWSAVCPGTISTNITVGCDATDVTPLVVNSGITLSIASGTALTYAHAITNGTLTNNGTIAAGSAAATTVNTAIGMRASGLSGSLTNSLGGVISGTARDTTATAYAGGVLFNGGLSGALSNAGTISADAQGVNWQGATGVWINGITSAGSLTNSGTISATVTTNRTTAGANSGSAYGVSIGGTVLGAVSNSGTISASATLGNAAGTTGWASAYGVGVWTTLSAALSNSGTIEATATSLNSAASAAGIYVNVMTSAGSVTNSGTISATATGQTATSGNWAGASGMVVVNMQSGGAISNSGTISATASAASGSAYGIVNWRGTGVTTLNNSGTIEATATGAQSWASAYGIRFANGTSSTSGSLSNSGTISATANGNTWVGAYGIYNGWSWNPCCTDLQADFKGTLSNSGTISATATGQSGSAYGIISNGSINALTNSGTISASASAVPNSTSGAWRATAYGVDVSGPLGSLTNSGTIEATANGNSWAGAWGMHIVNGWKRVAGVDSWPAGNLTGAFSNSGTITASAISNTSNASAYGVTFAGAITSAGSLSNSGTISASARANSWASATGVSVGTGIANSGTFTNSGMISASAISGRSSASAQGVNIWNINGSSAALTNSGTISASAQASRWASATGLRMGNVIDGTVTNSGTISAAAHSNGNSSGASATGILLGSITGSTATLTNSGTISASASGRTRVSASGIGMNTIGIDATLSNSGTISASAITHGRSSSGSAAGIWVTNLSGTLDNSGTISASLEVDHPGNWGWANGVSINFMRNGTFTNSGTISATVTGLNGAVGLNAYSIWVNNGYGNIDNQAGGVLNGNIDIGGSVNLNNAGSIYLPTGISARVGGDYTQAAGAVLSMGAADANNYTTLTVGGAASGVDAIAERVAIGHNLAAGDVLHVVTANGGLTANQAVNVSSNNALVTFSGQVNATGTGIDITVAQANTLGGLYGALGSLGSTLDAYVIGSQSNNFVANAQMDALVNGLNSLNTAADMNRAMQDLQPIISGGMDQVTAGVRHDINNVIRSRQDAAKGMSSGDEFLTNSNGWVKLLSATAKQKDKDLVAGYKADTSGIVLGTDIEKSSDTRVGVAFAYTNTKVNSNVGNSDAKMNSYELVGYGTYKLAPSVSVDWQADYASNTNKGNRTIAFLNQAGSASYDSSSIHVGAGVGRNLAMGNTSVTPSVRMDYTTLSEASYTDTVGQNVGARDTSALIFGVAADVAHPVGDAGKVVADLGMDFNASANKDNSVQTTYVGGGATWAAQGTKPGSSTVVAGVGFVYGASDAMQITARYDLATRSGYNASTASLKLKMPF